MTLNFLLQFHFYCITFKMKKARVISFGNNFYNVVKSTRHDLSIVFRCIVHTQLKRELLMFVAKLNHHQMLLANDTYKKGTIMEQNVCRFSGLWAYKTSLYVIFAQLTTWNWPCQISHRPQLLEKEFKRVMETFVVCPPPLHDAVFMLWEFQMKCYNGALL